MFPESVSSVPEALVKVALFESASALVMVWLPRAVVIEGALLPCTSVSVPPPIVQLLELLAKVIALSAALVVSVIMPPEPLAKVAVSLVERLPSRPGVPPLASQLVNVVQLPLPAIQVDCPL